MTAQDTRRPGAEVTLAAVPWDDASAVALREAQQVELRARYGDEGTPEPPATQVAVTIVLAVDGVPAGCGSLRDLSAEHGPGTAEVKRVYVAPGYRGRGYSRVVMRELEERAAAGGYARLVLEAGLQQPEAIGLYLALGYRSIPTYGEWAGVADSRCFAKDVAAAGTGAAGTGSAGTGAAGTGAAGARSAPEGSRGSAGDAGPPVRVEDVPFDHPEAVRLRAAMGAELLAAYPELVPGVEARGGFAAVDAALGDAVVATVLAWRGDRAVGCASLGRPHRLTGGQDPARTGELRRVHVDAGARRAGVAAAMVRVLEARARELGLRDVVLETGIRQPGAVALYRSLGYRPVLPFGDWEDDALGLYLGRTLG